MKALVVDDDLALADVVSFTLRRAGFEVILAHDGQTALDLWQSRSPDLIILDWNLPRFNGISVCRQIRALDDETLIVMLTVRSDEDDIIQGLRLGADDYILKPFSPRQLVARIEALMRRSHNDHLFPEPLSEGDLTLDVSRSQLLQNGAVIVQLTRLESRLLECLLRNHGQVLLNETLIDHIWGPEGGGRTTLKQLVYRLRRKLENTVSLQIESIPGIGYALH